MAKRTGTYYIQQARRGGCRVENGKGDHYKIYPPNGSRPMIVPQNLKGNGTEWAIIKWLKALGILLAVILALVQFV